MVARKYIVPWQRFQVQIIFSLKNENNQLKSEKTSIFSEGFSLWKQLLKTNQSPEYAEINL